ncbi:MAG: hypothetical protein R6V60_02545 [Desulfobacterales bacterium]|jgi:hypothetical protein
MKRCTILALLMGLAIGGCSDAQNRTKGVYMLIDASATCGLELNNAQTVVSYLLGAAQPEDSLAVARVDTGSFTGKDIIATMTFDRRPSVANNQKRAFQKRVNDFAADVKNGSAIDISGGILQAIEYLNEARVGRKYILIFADFRGESTRDRARNIPFQLSDVSVIALKVTRLAPDSRGPANDLERLELWRAKVEDGRGKWQVIDDLERIDTIFNH